MVMWRGRGGILLWLALLSATLATRAPKHMPKFVFSRSESPITVPLSVNVVLVGFGDHASPSSFRLNAPEFEQYLTQVMPDHHPTLVEVGEKLHVSYEVWYDVAHATDKQTEALAHEIQAGMRKSSEQQPANTITGEGGASSNGGMVPVYYVHVEGSLEKALDATFQQALDQSYHVAGSDDSHAPNQERAYGLLIINMDKNRIAPSDQDTSTSPDKSGSYAYRYVMGSGRANSGSDTFVTKGRFAVADLSAGPSQFGSSQAGEGAVVQSSLPRSYHKQWKSPNMSLRFRAELANIVISAVMYLFAPDIQFDALDFSERVLVPLIVFRNHLFYNPLEKGNSFSIDVAKIESEIQRMAMPGQQVQVITGLQGLSEHERISIALRKSTKSDTVHESHGGKYQATSNLYIDSKSLFQELKESSDYLASGLISSSPVLSHTYFPDFTGDGNELKSSNGKKGSGKWAMGTRVLPVYVFSLMDELRPLLFDTKTPYAISKEAVLVVQTGDDLTLPFFTGTKPLKDTLRDPTASIIAGVGAALGGLMPPHRRYAQSHQKLTSNYLWAHGHNAFGPFSNTSGFSQISIDSILMNSVISRLDASVERVSDALLRMDDFADKYLYDPLGVGISEGKPLGLLERLQKRGQSDSGPLLVSYETLRELHDDLLELEKKMSQHVETLYMQEPAKVHQLSDEIFKRASAFHAHSIEVLAAAEERVECCSVQHAVVKRHRWSMWIRALLIGLIAACLVALVAFLNPQRRTRLKPKYKD